MIFVNYLTIVSILIFIFFNPISTIAAEDMKSSEVPAAKKPDEFSKANKVILIVWDGLRPDVITKENTPNLYQLKTSGAYFSDHHSSFPSITMNNANSFATGSYSGSTGFFGNKIWRPDEANIPNSQQPVNVEHYDVLKSLDNQVGGKPLMYLDSILQVAHKNGFKTAQVGKEGSVLIQNGNKDSDNSIILTENKIFPEQFLKKLQAKKYILPDKFMMPGAAGKNSNIFKQAKTVELTGISNIIPLANLSDPSKVSKPLEAQFNEYMLAIYIREVLNNHKPDISILWFSEPDSTSHAYGPGTIPYYQALKKQDQLLGSLIFSLGKLDTLKTTNLIVTSDHSMSSVSGDVNIFPLRQITNGIIGDVNSNGFSTSGSIRIADLLTKAGFSAYDGRGCYYNPGMNGILKDRTLVEKINIDKSGKVCNNGVGALYTSRGYKIPEKLGPEDIIVANNGASAYIYVPSKDENLVKKLVRFFQSRMEFDGIFIDPTYGDLPGTLSLKKVFLYDEVQQRHPDIVVSLTYDDTQSINGLKGITYTTSDNARGGHGSLSPIDLHNVLIAAGPDFKQQYQDYLPTANVDVPVTIAKLFDLPFENRSGRVLYESLMGSEVTPKDYEIKHQQIQPTHSATDLAFVRLDSTGQQREYYVDRDKYTFVLNTKELTYQNKKYTYIDSGKAVRY